MPKKTVRDFDLLSVSYQMKKSPIYDGMHVECMDPEWISLTEDDMFLKNRPDRAGYTVEDYSKSAPYLSEVYDSLLEGRKLEDIMARDDSIGKAATLYFSPDTMIRADVYGGDDIRLEGHGVQQLLAAQKANVPGPVFSPFQPETNFVREMRVAELNKHSFADVEYEDPPFMQDSFERD